MVIDSPLLYFQQDFITLKEYYEQKNVSLDSIKRRMFINLRKTNSSIPDHYILLNDSQVFSEVKSFNDLFTKALPNFACEYLDFDKTEKKVIVKENMFIKWQDNICFISPLLMISACIYKKYPFANNCYSIKNDIFSGVIKKNTLNTSLISPKSLQLDKLLEKINGFNDLHIHLNGVVEADTVWESLLYDTDSFLPSLINRFDTFSFKQEIEQIGVNFCVNDIYKLIERAKLIREQLFDICFSIKSNNQSSFLHPFISIINGKKDISIISELLRYESLMYVLTIRKIFDTSNEKISILLHEYLLIKGFINKLLVHSKEKFGFEQFQNITKNDIREIADKNQLSKFLQLSGNSFSNFKLLELRFSPKDSVEKNIRLLKSVSDDWNKFQNIVGQKTSVDYCFIAHFIKAKADEKRKFEYLRTSIMTKAECLISCKNNLGNNCKIVGIDAAASEFDTPPEVFASVYKYLREEGFRHFTFHAGEDFYHILSGLRAIYEAIIFCDLRNGDRIGHACAAGIDINSWRQSIGNEIFIPKGEYIDDLLFVYIFISEEINELSYLLPKISNFIISGYNEIFSINATIMDIITAWKLRANDPNKIDYLEYPEIIRKIIYFYNEASYCKKYNTPIKITIDSEISIDELKIIQKHLLRFMHEREIVIETLPTSNLRIGCHKNLATYQLFNWYKWKIEGYSIPPIVLGSDDPGIFQTNIYNEYALVFCHMVYELGISRQDASNYIKELIENSENYKFY